MKYLLLTISILATGCATAGSRAYTDETCDGLARIAEAIAQARYNGLTMREAMAIIRDRGNNEVGRAIVKDAYKLPTYTTDKYQARAVQEFSNQIFADCIEIEK